MEWEKNTVLITQFFSWRDQQFWSSSKKQRQPNIEKRKSSNKHNFCLCYKIQNMCNLQRWTQRSQYGSENIQMHQLQHETEFEVCKRNTSVRDCRKATRGKQASKICCHKPSVKFIWATKDIDDPDQMEDALLSFPNVFVVLSGLSINNIYLETNEDVDEDDEDTEWFPTFLL